MAYLNSDRATGVDDHKAFYEEVGRRIRDARKRRNPKLTQQGLAELVSLTRTSITNVERGRQKFLLHTLADLAKALQVEPASLLPRLEAEPERTGRQLLERLQAEYPGLYPNGLIRTLQRRLKIWRQEIAHRMVFGPMINQNADDAATRAFP